MAGLGYVTLNKFNQPPLMRVSTDESYCGMLFDISQRINPFDRYQTATQNYKGNKVVLVNNIKEVEESGITDGGILNGVPYYHISAYYDYIGEDAPLYIMFADCSTGFNVLIDFQRAAEGKLFQIGVWTERYLWTSGYDTYQFTNLLSQLNSAAEELSGRLGEPTLTTTPVSIILSPCTAKLQDSRYGYGSVNYRMIPYAKNLNYPKISILLGQDGTDKVHAMQKKNINYTPVGLLGKAMACLHLAPAEESIGFVDNYNLSKDNLSDPVTKPEFGFGFISEASIDDDFSEIEDVSETQRNLISLAGYIILTTYPAKESEVFFSNDQTLSSGDYRLISLNRTIHKCRRALKTVLMPFVNGGLNIDPQTGSITASDITILTNAILDELDKSLVNKRGEKQISDRMVTIEPSQPILENDELKVDLSVIPVSISDVINVEETFSTS